MAIAPCLKAFITEKGHKLNMGYRVFSAGQYKIRQRGKKYYVYKIEKDSNGNVKETYVGPLDKIVEFYVSIGGVGVSPTVDRPGFEPGTSRLQASERGENPSFKLPYDHGFCPYPA